MKDGQHIVDDDHTLVGIYRGEAPTTGTCLFCNRYVEDGREESGYTGNGTDWMDDGDFGCSDNPINSEDGTGGHWTLWDFKGLLLAAEAFPATTK